MSEVVRYGATPAEKTAAENLDCRRIVREISLYGISQRQQLFIIYLLALELEDIDAMKSITAAIKSCASSNSLFLAGTEEEKSDGSSDS